MKICVFYSKGRSFLDALRVVRRKYPTAEIRAMVPPDYPMTGEELGLVNERVETDQARYSLRDLSSLLRLVNEIRLAEYRIFVITFNSPKLNMLAALSGASEKIYCSLDGRLIPIYPGIAKVLIDLAYRNVRGRLTYAGVWLAVHCLKVGRQTK